MNKNIFATIAAIVAIDLVNDILFLNSIFSDEGAEEAEKHPLIGRRYIVTDNSYAIDKESGVSVGGLHDKEYIIVSDPYVEEVEFIGIKREHLFVDVFSVRSAKKYRVLFQENGVIED